MKTPGYFIHIPEPCDKDWNTMQPEAKGRFCSSCSKVVVDFSDKSDAEIRDILLSQSNEKVCGHFKRSQVDRPLEISISITHLPKYLSASKAFAIAVFLAFGTFLFSCTNPEGKKIEKIEVTSPEKNYTTGLSLFYPAELKGEVIVQEDSVKTGTGCSSDLMGEIAPDNIVEDSLKIPEVIDTAIEVEPMIMGKMAYIRHDTDETQRIDSAAVFNSISGDDQLNLQEQQTFLIYPNPASGEFTLKYENSQKATVRIDMFDLNGAWIKTITNITAQYEGRYEIPVSLNTIANGLYNVVMIKDGKRYDQRVIVEK